MHVVRVVSSGIIPTLNFVCVSHLVHTFKESLDLVQHKTFISYKRRVD